MQLIGMIDMSHVEAVVINRAQMWARFSCDKDGTPNPNGKHFLYRYVLPDRPERGSTKTPEQIQQMVQGYLDVNTRLMYKHTRHWQGKKIPAASKFKPRYEINISKGTINVYCLQPKKRASTRIAVTANIAAVPKGLRETVLSAVPKVIREQISI